MGLTTEQIRVGDAVAVVAAGGELDRVTSEQLKLQLRAVMDEGARYVCLDLLEVSYMDSSGFGPMIEAHHRLHAAGGAITVSCRDILCEIFEVTGLASVFVLHRSREEALAYLTELSSASTNTHLPS
jgi:anti-sigma B factor antagonist